ncbi:hypothetical protein PTSG_07574 [Salpingoeca rosetta]|uniref:Uncharacterized protein n=1 Tax=Salpingoeca rosetta (strain ATCC 50818 / BSB-021) TaxID=946362 RepID=F2UH56_SALR5|nr:uncharacterized protein PTSG_07574 [Salpingoeca rosetta]EGD76455.1 hypothetical protein PTSG_07574 [Salpingoeca rosetta]|eukprot:XP_004991370.1 hypothetical protein PTSG_07574 [Salpingoeca rosetta]
MAIQPNRKLLTSAAAFLLFAAALVFLLRDNHDYHHDHHEEQSAPITAAAADSRLSDGQPSLLQCDHSDSRLRQRHFLPPAQQHKAPALLWSQPGSGNTMTRLLIEYATGYLTGSPYGDKSLLDVLPGEDTCDSSVIAVKLHPLINPRRTNKEDHYTATFKREHGVCDGVSVFARAIILVRNPLDAIWADYQRFISGRKAGVQVVGPVKHIEVQRDPSTRLRTGVYLVEFYESTHSDGIFWFVLRQDTFGKPGEIRPSKFEAYSGKTLATSYDLKDARIVPLAKPPRSFQVTLKNGKKLVFQPESESAADCAEWVTALQMAVNGAVTFADVHESGQLARRASSKQQRLATAEDKEGIDLPDDLHEESEDEEEETMGGIHDTSTPTPTPSSTTTTTTPASSTTATATSSSGEQRVKSGPRVTSFPAKPVPPHDPAEDSDDTVQTAGMSEDGLSAQMSTFSFEDDGSDASAAGDDADEEYIEHIAPDQFDFTSRPQRHVTPSGRALYIKCLVQRLADMAAGYAERGARWGHRFGFDAEKHVFLPDSCQAFLSSTFRDTTAERNVLFNHAVPVIKSWARLFNITFSLVDMRWGANHELSSELAITACMSQVKECVRNKRPSTAFIALLTDRSGYRVVPATLSAAQMAAALKNDAAKPLVQAAYTLDENTEPPVYRLHHELGIQHDVEALRDALIGANIAVRTATEEEVITALDHAHSPARQVLWLQRSLVEGEASDDDADVYFDLEHDEEVNTTRISSKPAQEMALSTLDESCLMRRPFKVKWIPDGLEDNTAFIDYLTELCVETTRVVINRIGASFRSDLRLALPEWCREAVAHVQHAQELAGNAVSRDAVMAQVMTYVNASTASGPLVVTGPSGSGKSTVLAQVVTELAKDDATAVIARFAGFTAKAASLTHTLRLLTQQFLYLVHPEMDSETIPTDFRAIISVLPQHLANLAKLDKRIVLIIDSLDEYVDDENRLDERVGLAAWLPTVLPDNVRLIVSAREHDRAFEQLSELVQDDAVVTLGPMDEAESKAMFERILSERNRKLTAEQHDAVHSALASASPLPLAVYLLADTACEWRSSDAVPELTTSILPILDARLQSIEDKLGQVFVSRTLGYLTCSRNGLNADELCLILSADHEVMASISRHHLPPDGTLPQHLIFMLKSALGAQLNVGTDESITWAHHQYHQAADLRYLSDAAHKRSLQQAAGAVLLEHLRERIVERERSGQPGPPPELERFADVIPWLFMQAGDHDALRETLNITHIFMFLQDYLYQDVNYDLAAYWRFLGDSPEDIVSGFANLLDAEHLDEGKARFLHVGLAGYLYCAGHYQHALNVLEPCGEWRRKHLGEHDDTAMTINFQGMCALELGDRALALERFEESLEMRLKLGKTKDLGKAIAASYNNIAIIHKREGRYEQALETYNQALELQKKINPNEDNVSIMQIMNNVASVHSVMGNYPKAYDLYKMVVDRRRKYFGPSVPLSVALFNLGLVAFRQERYGLAQEHIQDCLEIRLRLLGPTHQSTASAMSMRAHVLLKTKQPQQAKDMFLRVLHVRESSGNKSMLCMTYADVARACTALKHFEEAESYLEKSKALCSSDPLDPRNADYAEAAGDLALAKGDRDQAREMYAECIDLYRHTYDADHPQVRRIHVKLGLTTLDASTEVVTDNTTAASEA